LNRPRTAKCPFEQRRLPVSRVNDHVHFVSDVVAGALIGRAVGKEILARHSGRKFAWQAAPLIDRKTVGMMITIGPSQLHADR